MEDAIKTLQEAYKLLSEAWGRHPDNQLEIADAIDHTAGALRSLGVEPIDTEEDEQLPESISDDGSIAI